VADEPQSAKGGGGAGWLAGCGIVAGANLGCFLPLMLAAFFFVGYMSVNGLTPEGDSGTGAAGPISETIPESLRPVFEKAGAAHGVPPNLIAAIFGYGEHCQKRSADRATCLTPGFPTQGPWASNKTTNASGPFQFMECTWEGQQPVCDRIGRGDGTFSSDPAFIKSTSGKSAGMGEDCDGDGRADVQNLYDANCAAATHLSAAKGVVGTSPEDLRKVKDAAFSYNHADWYAESVKKGYVNLSGGSL
jgi:hypothetical protein